MTCARPTACKSCPPVPTVPGAPRVRIRPLSGRDAAAYAAFVRGLSRETLNNRLLGAGLAVTSDGIERLLRVDQSSHVALAATTRIDGETRIIGIARYALESASDRGEMAVTVADEWQGMGIGCRLLRALVRHARKAGVAELFGDAFATNDAMIRLMRGAGFTLGPSPGDAHLTRGSLRLVPPRPRNA
jgi:acetyltransferase